VTGWQPPAFNPNTGLFYVNTSRSYSIFYVSDVDDHPEGYGGIESGGGSIGPSALRAIDYKTGKPAWQHEWLSGGGGGMLTTAGNLLITGSGNKLIAFNATNGSILWGTSLLAGPAAPITYMLDGKQYLAVIAADVIYAFVMNSPGK
jgi:alcohol dehydrogenase (cytochrome c)